MKHVLIIARSWVGMIAVVSVAMLGVLALDRSHDQQHETLNAVLATGCERLWSLTEHVNDQAIESDRIRMALSEALNVATEESGQESKHRVRYARLQGILDSSDDVTVRLDFPSCGRFRNK